MEDMSHSGFKYGIIKSPGEYVGFEDDAISSYITKVLMANNTKNMIFGCDISKETDPEDIVDFNDVSGLNISDLKSYDFLFDDNQRYLFFVMYDSVLRSTKIPTLNKIQSKEAAYVRYICAVDIYNCFYKYTTTTINSRVADTLRSGFYRLSDNNRRRASCFFQRYLPGVIEYKDFYVK